MLGVISGARLCRIDDGTSCDSGFVRRCAARRKLAQPLQCAPLVPEENNLLAALVDVDRRDTDTGDIPPKGNMWLSDYSV